MGIKRYHDRLLAQISIGMSAVVRDLHRAELERLGRRAEAACECRDMLTDLKERIALRAATRVCSATVMADVVSAFAGGLRHIPPTPGTLVSGLLWVFSQPHLAYGRYAQVLIFRRELARRRRHD